MRHWERLGKLLMFSLVVGAAANAVADPLPPPPETAPAPVPATAPAPPQSQTAQPSAAPNTTVIGALELTPIESVTKVSHAGKSTCLTSTIRFRMKNASNSDVKVGLIMSGLAVTDDLGEPLLST